MTKRRRLVATALAIVGLVAMAASVDVTRRVVERRSDVRRGRQQRPVGDDVHIDDDDNDHTASAADAG